MNLEQIALSGIRLLSKQKRLTDWFDTHTSWNSPFSDARASYPYPIFEQERSDGPIQWFPAYQEWVILGYDECLEALASPDLNSSTTMASLLSLRPYSQLSDKAQRFVAGWLVFLDKPQHTRLRQLVSRAFTPRQIERLEPRINEIADSLLADIPTDVTIDLFDAYTSPLPSRVMGELLGVPNERWDWLQATTTELGKLLDPIRGFDPAVMETAVLELTTYISELAELRRSDPRDDLISALVQVHDGSDRLSSDELITLVGTLIFAGNETSTGLLGNAIVALSRYPNERAKLQQNPALWPNAIEELLRYDPPVVFVPRTATRTTTLSAHTIKAGQRISVTLGAANRDPLRYDRPHDLIVDRDNPNPIAFGQGIHHCLGAALARTQARIGLKQFVDAFGDYAIEHDAIEWRRSATLRGPIVLPIARPGR